MGGRITLGSEPGKGSEFTLQILLPSLMGIYKQPQKVLRITRQQKNKTIMVVDDEKYHCQLIDDLLSPAGFVVIQAHSAEEALKQIAVAGVDLFILDVNMPGMSGWTLLSELRQHQNLQPVIMLSADPCEAVDVNQMKDHFSAYLNKPVEFDRLISQIERLLDISIQNEDEGTGQVDAQNEVLDERSLAQLDVMRGYAKIGYLKGLTDCVAQLEERCHQAAWFSHLALLVEACDFGGIICVIDELGGADDAEA